MTPIGTVIDGKYEVLKEIGRGGMSVVYLAMDKRLNKQWAVKEIRKRGNGRNDEIVVNSLIAEANMMKRLDHPALPRIVDIIDNGVTIYVVMDYIEGESLDKILEEYGVQPEAKVLAWAKQLCDVLSYLHAQNPPIIYRDMKPANVMLKPEGNIKIIDFGIAREYKEQSLSDTTVLGTRGYAPPEQYSGQTDPRSDIFALGMTMHHLLTGVDPRGGDPYVPVRQWNPNLSEGIEAIIDKCVQPASENRYQTCADLLYDLEHPELITKGFKKKQKRKLGAVIASAALTVTLLLSGMICRYTADKINNNNYDSLVNVVTSTAYEDKVRSYKQAIDIFPDDTRAYICLLEAYGDDGLFDLHEGSEFSNLYSNANFDRTDVAFAELNYKAGMMFYSYYGDANSDDIYRTRVQKAHKYFEYNFFNEELEGVYPEQDSSDCYYQICTFLMDFVYDQSSEEASKADYDVLLSTMEDTISKVKENGSSSYERLSLFNATFMLLYDQRKPMASVGVDKERVLDILAQCYTVANRMTVNKEWTKALQSDIVDNYANFRNAIERTFSDKHIGG